MKLSNNLLIALTLCAFIIIVAGLFEESRMGLEGRYYTSLDSSGEAVAVQRDSIPELRGEQGKNIAGNSRYSVVWTGWLTIDKAGTYRFATNSDDGSTLWIDKQRVVSNGGMHGLSKVSGEIVLETGVHKIDLQYVQYGGLSVMQTLWTPPGRQEEHLPKEVLFPRPPKHYPGSMLIRRMTRYRIATILALSLLHLGVFLARGFRDVSSQRETRAARIILFLSQRCRYVVRLSCHAGQLILGGLHDSRWEQPTWIYFMLFAAYCLFSCIRLFEFSLVKEPFIWGDEYVYRILSYRYWTTGDFYASTDSIHQGVKTMPNLVYPFLISWLSMFQSSFLVLIKMFNVFVMNAAVFPFFLLGKQFVSLKEAFWLSILLLLLPWMNVGNFVMVEPLFFLLFWLTFYACYRFFVEPTLKKALLTGGTIALTYATKPTGIGILAACFGMMILLLIQRDETLKRRLRMVGLSGVMALSSVLCALTINFLLRGSFDSGLGFYQIYAEGMAENSFLQSLFKSKESLYMIVTHCSIVLFLYLIPLAVIGVALLQAWKQSDRRAYVFLAFGLMLGLIFLGITVKFTLGLEVESELGRLHTRYYFMTFPFYVMAFVLFLKKTSWPLPVRVIFGLLSLGTLLWNYFIFLQKFAYAQGHPMIIDNMTYSWVHVTKNTPFFVSIMALLYLAISLYYLVSSGRKRYPYIIFFIIFCVVANYYQIQFMIRSGQTSERFNRYKAFLASHIPDFSSRVVFIENFWERSPYKTYTDLSQMLFWLPYDVLQHKDKRVGDKIKDEHIPKDTEYVILTADYELELQYQNRWTQENYTILKR